MKLFSLSANLFDKAFSQKNRNFIERLTIWLALFWIYNTFIDYTNE